MTAVKTCGMFRPQDIVAVNAVRPDYVGFVFASSPRQVTREQAITLRNALDRGITPVGVFVNAEPEMVASLVNERVIDVAQLHGDENETYIAQLRSQLKRGKIMQVFRIPSHPQLSAELVASAKNSNADLIMFDRYHPDSYGGSGEVFDWSVLDGADRDFFLAGGLDVGNVAEAIDRLHPAAVDVSSALETDGVKDPDKIRLFVAAVRAADRQGRGSDHDRKR
ncbi:MAG: phosphoribosylanthranilate isomerase [Varibaculum sp.]|nr:phosphoribosylanthranilate isomerase [Varibaculum sp.]